MDQERGHSLLVTDRAPQESYDIEGKLCDSYIVKFTSTCSAREKQTSLRHSTLLLE